MNSLRIPIEFLLVHLLGSQRSYMVMGREKENRLEKEGALLTDCKLLLNLALSKLPGTALTFEIVLRALF